RSVGKEVEVFSHGQQEALVSSAKSFPRYDEGDALIQDFDSSLAVNTSIEHPIATVIFTNSIDEQTTEHVIPSFLKAYKSSSLIVPVGSVAEGVVGGVGEGIKHIKRKLARPLALNWINISGTDTNLSVRAYPDNLSTGGMT
ncbi:hypothetical protein FRC01_014463, partial [Tulasnella sp. 417]